jgi:hypothetical protein
MRLRKWLRTLSWPALIAVGVAIMGATFALNVAFWWLAHQLDWWVYALILTGWMFGLETGKSFVSEARKHLAWKP